MFSYIHREIRKTNGCNLAASRGKKLTGHAVLPDPLLPFPLGVLLLLDGFDDEFVDEFVDGVGPWSILPIENKLLNL
jgi:hypothetical protein